MWYAGWIFIIIGLALQINVTLNTIPALTDISTWIIVGSLIIGAILLGFGRRSRP